MPYLVDGHNLIPKLPGLDLEAPDDEQQLISLLQEYCRLQRKQVEVYFDNAPPAGVRARNYGLVTARFVRQGTSADQALAERLRRLGRAARNWTVVSSDQAVQAAARAVQARVLSAEAFASLLMRALEKQQSGSLTDGSESLSAEDVQEWMDIFSGKGKHKE